MPAITPQQLVCYSPASRPVNDSTTAGGNIDATSRPTFIQLTANAVIQVLSDGADTRTVSVTGRRASDNTVVTENIVLNGAAVVTGTTSFERIQEISLSASSATRTVTVRQGAGGPTRATIGPNETRRHMQFRNAQADAAVARVRYEKQCWQNNHATETLYDAFVMLVNDPNSKYAIAVESALNGTLSVANRLTAPAGPLTFWDSGARVYVPGFNLTPLAFIGVWVRQSLDIADQAYRDTIQIQLQGASN